MYIIYIDCITFTYVYIYIYISSTSYNNLLELSIYITTYSCHHCNNPKFWQFFWVLFENKAALYFCNYIFITAHKMFNF